jgi:hypothetical protein
VSHGSFVVAVDKMFSCPRFLCVQGVVKNFRYCNGQLGMELHVIYRGTKSTNEQNSSIIIDLNFFVQAHVDDIGNQSIRLWCKQPEKEEDLRGLFVICCFVKGLRVNCLFVLCFP